MAKINRTNSTHNIDKSRGHQLGRITAAELLRMHQSGVNKIACILNTDTCLSNGMHWVALFINIEKGHILFFNSVGS